MSTDVLADHTYKVSPHYLDGPSGRLFVTHFAPARPTRPKHAVVCLPPFAEELNKSRRMLALQGQHLAREGLLFVLPDLHGTGDSDGDFDRATWEGWIEDVRVVADSLVAHGIESLSVLTLRSGAYLLPGLLSPQAKISRIVMWAPVQSGRKMVDQLLRTKVVRDAVGAAASSVNRIRDEIRSSGALEVAGYLLSDALVQSVSSLELATLSLPERPKILWVDVSPVESQIVPPAVGQIVGHWKESADSIDYVRVAGPPFWMGPEIELLHRLHALTTDYLLGVRQ